MMSFNAPKNGLSMPVVSLMMALALSAACFLACPAYASDGLAAEGDAGEEAVSAEADALGKNDQLLGAGDIETRLECGESKFEDVSKNVNSADRVPRQKAEVVVEGSSPEEAGQRDEVRPELQVDEKSAQAEATTVGQQAEAKAGQRLGSEGGQKGERQVGQPKGEPTTARGNNQVATGKTAQAATQKSSVGNNATVQPKPANTDGKVLATTKGAMSKPVKSSDSSPKVQSKPKAKTKPSTVKSDLESGKYYIVSALNTRQVLDVNGASKANCGNVIAWHGTGNANQQWDISFDKNGYAVIASVNSKKVLDIEGAKGKSGSNVIQYKANNGKNQKWVIKKQGDSFVVVSALNSNLVIDLTGNRAKDGTNVEVWKRNNGKNQLFRFIPIIPVKASPGTQVVADGVYSLKAVSANKTTVDIEAGSRANGANALTWKANGAAWQAWYLAYDNAGYYTISSVNSGKRLAPASSCALNGINVGQYSIGADDRAKWKIIDAGSGQYTLTNKSTGTSLAVGSVDKGGSANVQMSRARQQFTLTAKTAVPTGAACIEVASNTKLALDVYGNSIAKYAKMGTYTENGGLNQRFLITPAESGYTIRPFNSRMYLTASSSGDLIQEPARKNLQNQIWVIRESRGLVTFVNETTGKAIAKTGDAGKDSSRVKVAAKPGGSAVQKFYIHSVAAVSSGTYVIGLSSKQNAVLDVEGANRKNNANVDLWKKNNGNNQKFAFTPVGGNAYKITNLVTGRVLDVSKASTKAGANVIMYKWNGGANQKWHIDFNADFSLKITNVQTGYSLDTSKSSTSNGTNVIVNVVSEKKATQKFWIQDASYSAEIVNIGVPCYMQNPELPTGCESVALTNALRYWGYGLGKTTIADSYMPYGDDGVYDFIGSPYDYSGWIICAPGITNTANAYLSEVCSDVVARNITGTSLSGLRKYLDRGQPVVVWTTIGMGEPGGVQWYSSGYPLRNNNHAVVLAGYDPFDGEYLVADSLSGIVWRNGGTFEYLYDAMGKQAVVLEG